MESVLGLALEIAVAVRFTVGLGVDIVVGNTVGLAMGFVNSRGPSRGVP